jgi:hypothetical protein
MGSVGIIDRLCLPSLITAGLLFGFASAAAQGTDEERRACTPDAIRLCRDFLPNVGKITDCMTAKKAELSDACRTVMFTTAKPVATAATSAAKNPKGAREAKSKIERHAERRTQRKMDKDVAKVHKKGKAQKLTRAERGAERKAERKELKSGKKRTVNKMARAARLGANGR